MFGGHYIDWRKSRMDGIRKYMGTEFFKGKTLLELGAGEGHNGYEFMKLGCQVMCTEVRQEHIDRGKQIYPQIKFKQFDCNTSQIKKHYDIILHWGVLYHIENVQKNLVNVLNHCDYLLLETEVIDHEDSICPIVTENNSYDQAFHFKGSRPSTSYIETIFDTCGFKYQIILDPILNSGFHRYDWKAMNTKLFEDGQRRFWICWKETLPSPII